ncbi:MAG: pilus assembly protein [Actinomycetota bacterium]|nr:pilus assembly protein [Actinomycetota bacterium]
MIRRRDPRGQTLVEFAFILPLFVFLLVAIFDLGHVVWANDTLSNGAREAARYAIVHGAKSATPGTRQDVKDVALNWAKMAGTGVTVTLCGGAGCTGDTDVVGYAFPYNRGDTVTVTVSADVTLAAPAFFGFGSIHLSNSSTMLVNH